MLIITLSGCTSLPQFSSSRPNIAYNEANHLQYLQRLNNWQVTGKIALISDKSRESASLYWQNQPYKQQEKLALTTYLGINILSIERVDRLYQIKIDDQVHQHRDLEHLLWSLSGYQLPTNALKFWLKGIPYSNKDKVTYADNKLMPQQITSHYNGSNWVINYQSFTTVDGIPLPDKISIKQDKLTIKLSINQWTL